MPQRITIKVRRDGAGYVAGVKEDLPDVPNGLVDYPYGGNSPDEAIGYCVRELYLGGAFAGAVYLDFDIQSDTPA